MTDALLVSNILLWIALVSLALVVLALIRQVGVLHERIAPAGALQPTQGPKVGELTEPLQLTTLAGDKVAVGGANDQDKASLVLFISPTCPMCKSLVPIARSLARSEGRRLRLLFASDGADSDAELQQHRNYVSDLGISEPYIISRHLGMSYQVSKLPFALLIDADGILRSKGLVNTREHLESLIESMDSGVATVQDYVSARQAPQPTTVEHSS